MAREPIRNFLLAILVLTTAMPAPGAFAARTQVRLPLRGPLPAARPQETPPPSPAETESHAKDAEIGRAADEPETDDEKAEKTKRTEKSEEAPPPVAPEDEEAHAACLLDLRAIGATFTEIPRIDDDNGCGIDRPVVVAEVLPGVALSPEASLRCETALQLARMTRDALIPAARIGLPDRPRLTAINQASGYVCRRRNGAETGKTSEHARGNAIDIASLSFGTVDVPMTIVTREDSTLEAAFQRTLNAAACLYFTTVLSPGSDEAHQDHMHLDVIERRAGYRYCR